MKTTDPAATGPLPPPEKSVRVFDPPLCCSTGVCGPEPDPALARFASDLKWIESHGVRVERFSLSRQPEAFVRTPAVAEALRRLSVAALPLVLVDGEVLVASGYPTRAALAARLELPLEAASATRLRILDDSGGVPGSGCCS